MKNSKDVIVIGAGPIGLAAAAQLVAKGLNPVVLEQGASAGEAMLAWGHVRVFTPWSYMIDHTVAAMLGDSGWQSPDLDLLPTGREIVEQYLLPAAAMPSLVDKIKYHSTVIAIAKENHSKQTTNTRDDARYVVHYRDLHGEVQVIIADAVIDASGTWSSPNPIGLDGLAVPGERENQAMISYGMPDLLGAQRLDYADKKTLVIGGGHSSMNIALSLIELQQQSAQTKIFWGLRTNNIDKLLGGGINDQVPARKKLGIGAKKAMASGALTLLSEMKVQRIEQSAHGLNVTLISEGVAQVINVDRIIVATGFRPNLEMLRELRLDIDSVVEAPVHLAPLIDPNLHSCGSVRAHGVEELAHKDKNFFIAGMKSYGRAPTFLMLTGYEQVRSIVAELAGDHQGARQVELFMPDHTTNNKSCCAG